jgi:rhamnosyltransferase
MNYKTAAVVVLFNPDYSVNKNIYSYLDQVDLIIIVDNSFKSNSELIKKLKCNEKIEVIINNDNLGIAAALNLGAQKAISLGYEYIITMDQDSSASENMVSVLLNKMESLENAAIISPLHINKNYKNLNSFSDVEEVNVVMTSGNLVYLRAYQKVGGFDERLFIDYVDIDFCLRLRIKGFKIYKCNSTKLGHNEGNLKKVKCFGVVLRTYNHNPFRWYYKIRNFNYIKKAYLKTFPLYVKEEKKRIVKDFFKVLFFERERVNKIRWMIIGYFNFKNNITGRYPFN